MKLLPLKFLVFIAILILTCIYRTKPIQSSNTYFEDFNDGTADGWTVNLLQDCLGSNWKIENGMYGFKVDSHDPKNGCKTTTILTGQEIPSDASYIYEFDMKFTKLSEMDRNILVKYVAPDRWYGFHFIGNIIIYERVYPGSNPFPELNYNFQLDYIHHFKITVNGIYTTLDIDQGNFLYTYKDSNDFLTNKYVGLRASTGLWLSTEVWFDNILLTIIPKLHKFNLPISYINRNNPLEAEFQNAFWRGLTAAFDHNKQGNKFIPFTTAQYDKKECPKGKRGITCYDAHNGTDFSKASSTDINVYPTTDGKVVYISEKDNKGRCIPDKSGYGCVVIIYHTDLDVYTLYAHLSEIIRTLDSDVKYTEVIGKMGNTGCGPKCGVHLHLGVLKDKTPSSTKNIMKMSDWESLLKQVEPLTLTEEDTTPKHFCSYRTPNGNILSFQDPSGWSDTTKIDPWSLPIEQGSCATVSSYLWMHDIGTVNTSVRMEELWYSENLN